MAPLGPSIEESSPAAIVESSPAAGTMIEAAPAAVAPSAARIDGVDMLRGLAIFFVLMNHVNMRLFLAHLPYTHGLPRRLVSSLVWNGRYGVQIFFAVSGFLIASTSMRRWGSLGRIDLRDFYRLRCSRIAPLLLSLLLVLCALHAAGLPDFTVQPGTGGIGRALLAALTFHVNVLEAQRGYLPGNWDVLWSLSVEELFYLFFPILCVACGRSRLLLGILGLFVVLGPFGRTIFAHGNEVWQEYSYLGGMDAIALGCLTAMLLSRARLSRAALLAAGACGASALIFSLGFSREAEAWGLVDSGLDMTIVALGSCMLIAVAARSRWKGPPLTAPLRLLGRRSYEVYLTHMFVVFAFFDWFVATRQTLRAVPLLFAGTIVVAGLSGELVARYYSDPVNRWLRRRWARR